MNTPHILMLSCMNARTPIAHGGPQRLPAVDSVDDPLPLDWHHPSYATSIRVDGADRRDARAKASTAFPLLSSTHSSGLTGIVPNLNAHLLDRQAGVDCPQDTVVVIGIGR